MLQTKATVKCYKQKQLLKCYKQKQLLNVTSKNNY